MSSDLNKLFNEKIVSIQAANRDKDSWAARHLGVQHVGSVVTTESGANYLVHSGSGYGKSQDRVITDASHMSSKWTIGNAEPVANGATVGDLMKSSDPTYNLVSNNCLHSNMEVQKAAGKN